jgi:fructokinase
LPTVVCLGEALVDFVADTPDVSLIDCPGFRKAAGGAVANVSVGLARLGVDAAFIGGVGEDAFGHFLQRTFSASGVDTRFMRFDRSARTGLAFVSLQADGERDFVFFRNPSADMLLEPKDVPDEALEGCRFYHFGSISLIQDPSRAATLHTLERARAKGTSISFDPNLRPALWGDMESARREILTALPLADVLKVSEEEAEFLYGPGSLAEHAEQLHAAGPSLVSITLGRSGCRISNRSTAISVPGFEVAAVDTTGAGDGFTAALLAGLLQAGSPKGLNSAELEQLARFANAVGALTCTEKGAIPALPTREAAEAFLRSHGG